MRGNCVPGLRRRGAGPPQLILLIALITAILAGPTAARALEIGREPPPLKVGGWLQAPAEPPADWNSLKGNVVVLEFWATWCGPCVQAIPHMNELTVKFRDKPVRFLAFTREEKVVVARFLKRQPMHYWMGYQCGEMAEAFGARGIPMTVILDPAGKVAWIGHPLAMDEEQIKRLIEPGLPEAPAEPIPAEAPRTEGPEPLLDIVIRESPDDGGSTTPGWNGGNVTALRVPLAGALAQAWETTPFRMDIPKRIQDDEKRYDILIAVTDHLSGRVAQIYQRALLDVFGLKVRRMWRPVEVYVLAAPADGPAKGLRKPRDTTRNGARVGKTELQLRNEPVKTLAMNLENILDRPVLDETGIEGNYDMDLNWGEGGPRPETVSEQLGLRVLAAKRNIEIIVIEIDKGKEEAAALP